MNKDELFQGVYGLENEREEILKNLEWFENDKKYKDLGIKVPNALLLHGMPGCGKTLIMKKIFENSGLPCFAVSPQDKDVIANMRSIIRKANNEEKAIVFLDEIDLIIEKDERAEKFIQDQVDGIESNGKIFFIAATNHPGRLSRALRRNGRFGNQLSIEAPDAPTIALYFRDRMKEFYRDTFEEDYFGDEVFKMLEGNGFSDISYYINRLFLEYPNRAPSFEQFMSFLAKRFNGGLKIEESTDRVAFHEASHALLTHRYLNYFRLQYAYGGKDEGHVRVKIIEDGNESYESMLADIAVSYAGAIGEKALLGSSSVGSYEDLDKARSNAFVMVNRIGYKGMAKTMASSCEGRQPSEYWLRGNERKSRRLLRKIEKDDFRFIRKYEAAVRAVANKLKKCNVMLGSEIGKIFDSYGVKQDDRFIKKLVRHC